MKVMVLFTGTFPFGSVAAHRVRHLCKGLNEAGAAVSVLIPHPAENRPVPAGGNYDGIDYQYIMGMAQRPENLLIRKLMDVALHFATLVKISFSRATHLIVIGPSLDFRFWIPLLCKFRKIKTLLEINEYPFVYHEKSLSSRLKRALFLKVAAPFYDGFIAISTPLETLLRGNNDRKSSVIQIPVLTDSQAAPAPESRPPLPGPYIIHSGSVSEEKDGVFGIVRALGLVKHNGKANARLVITGGISAEKQGAFMMYAEECGLKEDVIFTGFLHERDLDNYMKYSTLAVINKYDNTQNRYCFATKLAVYLQHGIPVVCTKVGPTAQCLTHEKNAMLVPSSDFSAMATAIEKLLLDPALARQIGEAGRQTCASTFDYRKHGVHLYQFLNDLTAA